MGLKHIDTIYGNGGYGWVWWLLYIKLNQLNTTYNLGQCACMPPVHVFSSRRFGTGIEPRNRRPIGNLGSGNMVYSKTPGEHEVENDDYSMDLG